MHYIKPITRHLENEINHICFDVETNPDTMDFKLAVVSHKGKYYTTFNKEDMTRKIINCIREHQLNIIWSHQSEFDFSYVDFNSFINYYNFRSFNTDPFFAIFYSKRNKTKVTFLDTLNFIKDSLKNIGHIFSHEKFDIDFKKCSIKELELYCIRDVEILNKIVEWIMSIQEMFDVPFSITLPSLSYQIYRKHFLNFDIQVPSDKRVLQLERDSYFGGRVEVFDMREYSFINVYDINSLYPYTFKNPLPIKCLSYYSPQKCKNSSLNLIIDRIANEIDNGNGIIARLNVDIPYMKYPPIPYREPNIKKLLFPIGKFTTVLTTPEILEVLPFISKVIEFAVYKMEPILSEFGTHFYSLRMDETDEVMKLVWKLILNSLYGKFAQRLFIDTRLPELDDMEFFKTADFIDDRTGDKILVKWVAGSAFKKEIKDINPKSMVSIASHITAYARIELLKLLRESNAIYCDTDSIFTTLIFDTSTEIGKLKHEKTLHNFKAFGNKFYSSFELMKCKGVPRDADIIYESDKYITFAYNRIGKIQETIRRFEQIQPIIIPVIKEVSLEYDKRIVKPNGETIPIKFE